MHGLALTFLLSELVAGYLNQCWPLLIINNRLLIEGVRTRSPGEGLQYKSLRILLLDLARQPQIPPATIGGFRDSSSRTQAARQRTFMDSPLTPCLLQ